MTLIEILLMVMLVAIMTSLVVRIFFVKAALPRLDKAQQAVVMVENAMEFYKIDNGFYPTNAQGIAALVVKPTTEPIPMHWTRYLKNLPTDPSGRPYHYLNPGKHNAIDIYSDNEKKK